MLKQMGEKKKENMKPAIVAKIDNLVMMNPSSVLISRLGLISLYGKIQFPTL